MQLGCRCLNTTSLSTSPSMLCRRAALVFLTALPRPAVQLRPMHGVSEWKGLEAWRSSPIDERRVWGKNAPVVEPQQFLLGSDGVDFLSAATTTTTGGGGGEGGVVSSPASGPELEIADLASWGALVLVTTDPLRKASLTHQAFCLWTKGQLELGVASAPDVPGRPPRPELGHLKLAVPTTPDAPGRPPRPELGQLKLAVPTTPDAPGRPPRPELVPPRQVPSPKDCVLSPSAHMLHNLAHIELNAIDLAWDTVVRFSSASPELGRQFFADFVHVADDESRHFRWCSQRLNELGFSYGDMPAHNLLWKDCLKTSGDVRSRLAVIPMMQEARGLDAGPRLVNRLLGLDDHRSAAIVRRIGQEEVAHVGVGVSHFLRICKKLGVDPGDEFKELMVECNIELHGPFNHKAREMAGLQREWYDKSDPVEPSGVENALLKENSGRTLRDQAVKEQKAEMRSPVTTAKQALKNSKVDERPKAILQSASTDCKGGRMTDESKSGSSSSFLPEVYERLALLVAMEKENAGT